MRNVMGTGSRPPADAGRAIVVHLIDGTYELFRHFYGQRRFNKGKDRPFGAVAGVLHSVLEFSSAARRTSASPPTMSSSRSATACGRATRPAKASSRRCWRSSIRWRTRSAAMGVAVWPMTELEADDALASAAHHCAAG